jgi:hypothetical protein
MKEFLSDFFSFRKFRVLDMIHDMTLRVYHALPKNSEAAPLAEN